MTTIANMTTKLIAGHSLSGVAFVGEVDIDQDGDLDLDVDNDDFVTVKWPLRITEIADPRDPRKIDVGLQPLYLSMLTSEWKVRLSSYRIVEWKGSGVALTNGYHEVNKNERAREVGL